MSALLIDNYDSFVHNLARYIRELGCDTKVYRNDAITISEISQLDPEYIIISPGPCDPDQAGISLKLINYFYDKKPILGVCLGHQAIGQAFGGKVTRALKPMHGKQSVITHNQKNIFTKIPNPLSVARYHSLIVSDNDFPDQLEATAYSEDGEIMALRHKKYPVFGVQFHPESIITHHGYSILENFMKQTHEPYLL